jgi:hypothetical protein
MQRTQSSQNYLSQMVMNPLPLPYNYQTGRCMGCPAGCPSCNSGHPRQNAPMTTPPPSNPTQFQPQQPAMPFGNAPSAGLPPPNMDIPSSHPQPAVSQQMVPLGNAAQHISPYSQGLAPPHFPGPLPPPGLFGPQTALTLSDHISAQGAPPSYEGAPHQSGVAHSGPSPGSHAPPPFNGPLGRTVRRMSRPTVSSPPHPGNTPNKAIPLPPTLPFSTISRMMASRPIPIPKKATKVEADDELSTKLGYLTIDPDIPSTPPTPPPAMDSEVLHEMFKELVPLAQQISHRSKPFDTTEVVKAEAVASFKLPNPGDWVLSIRCHSGNPILVDANRS